MAFRFWAFRRWVFPDEFGRSGEVGVESAFTAGGIAEAMEDVHTHRESNVMPLKRPARRERNGSRRGRRDRFVS
jgi:hypothetical protein